MNSYVEQCKLLQMISELIDDARDDDVFPSGVSAADGRLQVHGFVFSPEASEYMVENCATIRELLSVGRAGALLK